MFPEDDLALWASWGRRLSPHIDPLSILNVSDGLDVRRVVELAKDVIEALCANPNNCFAGGVG